MAKLIRENVPSSNVKIFKEDVEGKKVYKIEGIFMQADKKNRNRRIYPSSILMPETTRYIKEYVTAKRAFGELGHPENPQINLERVSHIITNLRTEGSDIYGTAKIMDTPYGKIAKNFIDEGAQLGVSSRALGSVREDGDTSYIEEDLMLCAVDIVADPSAPDAFVEGIMENREWIYENGIIKSVEIEKYKTKIKKASKAQLEETYVRLFKDFLGKLSK